MRSTLLLLARFVSALSLMLIGTGTITGSQAMPDCNLPPLKAPSFPYEEHAHIDMARDGLKPSFIPHAPTPLTLGKLRWGHLPDSHITGKFHFWLVNVDAGSYKVVLDIWPDAMGSMIGGDLQWFTLKGEKLDLLGRVNKGDGPSRGVFRFAAQTRKELVLCYANRFAASTYWLGLFREDTPIEAPFFTHGSPLPALWQVGQSGSALLNGSQAVVRDAYYLMQLCAGNYQVTTEFRREDGENSRVGGEVDALGTDGDLQFRIIKVGDIGSSTKKISNFSVSKDATLMFQFRASFTQELVIFKIERLPDR